MPSGTMANLISFLVHCPRGTEALLGDKSHTFIYEAGGISAFGGIHSHQLKNNPDGSINLGDIKEAISNPLTLTVMSFNLLFFREIKN